MSLELEIERLDPRARLPHRATAGAAGLDLAALVETTIASGCWALLRTGLALAIPEGFEGQVRPRSGLAVKQGVTVLNAPGTIDSDYRGEVQVALINFNREAVTIAAGDRIAQLIIAPVVCPEVVEVEALDQTNRGAGGFGSTGR